MRDILREKWNVRTSKGVKNHLRELQEDGMLIKIEQRGKANIWKLNPDMSNFKKLAWKYLDLEDRFDFIQSRYVQCMLTDDFLDARMKGFYEHVWIPLKKRFEREKEAKTRLGFGGLSIAETFFFVILGESKRISIISSLVVA